MAASPSNIKAERSKDQDAGPESKYPLHQVTVFPGGARVEVGNEEGKQTFKFYHPSGTSFHFDPDGSMRVFCGGESRVEMNSKTETINGNADTHVKGHQSTTVSGGSRTTVVGNDVKTVSGTSIVNIMGDSGVAINGNATLVAKGNLNIDAQSDLNIRAKGGLTLGAGGGMKIQAASIDFQPEGDGKPGYNMGRSGGVA